jgi:hypothetical protein
LRLTAGLSLAAALWLTLGIGQARATVLGTIHFHYDEDASDFNLRWLDPFAAGGRAFPVEGVDGNLSGVAVIRDYVEWRDFEPYRDFYMDGGIRRPLPSRLITLLQRLSANPGLKASLLIRSSASDVLRFWAFDYAVKARPLASRYPRDLSTTWSPEWGYSESYFQFVYQLLKAVNSFKEGSFRGRLHSVVVENEMNTRGHFDARTADPAVAVDLYARMAATAKQAVERVNAEDGTSTLTVDGGLQGFAVFWVMLKMYFDEGDTDGALAFYRDVYPNDPYGVGEDPALLQAKVEKSVSDYGRQWVLIALRNSNLWRVNPDAPAIQGLPLDGMNVHNYQPYRAFVKMYAKLYRPFSDGLVLSNESGSKPQNENVRREDVARKDMVMKAAAAKYLFRGGMFLWFPFSERQQDLDGKGTFSHIGGFIEYNDSTAHDKRDPDNLKDDTVRVFKVLTDHLAAEEDAREDLSSPGMRHYRFRYNTPRKDVSVLWLATAGTFTPTCEAGLTPTVYNNLGWVVPDSPISTAAEQPFILVCR